MLIPFFLAYRIVAHVPDLKYSVSFAGVASRNSDSSTNVIVIVQGRVERKDSND